jgi:Fe-S-cluster-containing hydrogenase component 2
VKKNFGAAMGGLTRNYGACYGCRACELACSFHHLGVFSPGGGAIRVRKDNRTGKIEWTRSTQCDLCMGEAGPLCMKYCFYGALTLSKEGA